MNKNSFSQPNVFCIAVDDLNAWVNCIGRHPDAHTPHIDALASRGTLFRQAYCPAPVCVPARAAVLSGKAPSQTGSYVNGLMGVDDDPWHRFPVLEPSLSMPAWFRRHGYRTMGAGKVFHPDAAGSLPGPNGERGSVWDDYSRAGTPMREADPPERIREVTNLTGFAFHWGALDDSQSADLADEHTTRWVSDQLQRDWSQPFFLAAGFHRPHIPLTVPAWCFDCYDPETLSLPEPDMAAFENLPDFAKAVALTACGAETVGSLHKHIRDQDLWHRIVHAYLASVTYVDYCIGRILDALRQSAYADNTVVTLWGDHGWSLGDHCHWQKWALWRGVAQVPLIIARPGDREQVCDIPVSTLDLYPTLAELCGLPPGSEWDGTSLLPQLQDPASDRPQPAITSYGPGNHSVRTGEGTLIHYADGSEELYDPAMDPGEERNLMTDPAWKPVRDRLAAHLPPQPLPPLHYEGRDPLAALSKLQNGETVPLNNLTDGIAGREIHIEATFSLLAEDSLIVAMHGVSAGFALFTRRRRLHFALRDVPRPLHPDTFHPESHILKAEQQLPEGKITVQAHLETSGRTTLSLNGNMIARGNLPGPLTHQPACTFMAGHWCHLGDTYKRIRGYDLPPGDAPMSAGFPGTLDGVALRFL